MFNSKVKKASIERLKGSSRKYEVITDKAKSSSIALYEKRKISIGVIEEVEKFINELANTPKELDKDIAEITLNTKKFKTAVSLEIEANKATKVSGTVAGAGVVVGTGIAALGPTAAMAIATTFGTASTGAAISGLTGAAATNAALAWIGGGALAAGGGGMAAGNAFLALAGPVGWAIAGVGLAGGSVLASNKNKKVAEEAERESIKVEQASRAMENVHNEILEIIKLTTNHIQALKYLLSKIKRYDKNNYLEYTDNEKYELGTMVNNTKSLSVLLNRVIIQ